MAVQNHDIAAIFEEIADLLEIDDANPFRVRAYRNAARTIENLTRQASELVAGGDDLTQLPGIGAELAAKIEAIVTTGTVKALEELRKKLPAGLADMLKLPGLGPKKVKTLYRQLHVASLSDLEAAAKACKVRELPGMGAKTEEQILKAVAARLQQGQRFLRAAVAPLAEALLVHLKRAEPGAALTLAGSFRRARDTVGDLDILAVSAQPEALMRAFAAYDAVQEILAEGPTKSSVRLRGGLQVDLRVVESRSFGAALHYFTGSQAHNIAMRRLAQQRGLKLNEYGLFEGERQVAGATEEDVFAALEVRYIAPELREGRDELERAARADGLPELIELDDIRGDLHCHSTASDGRDSIRDMALAARARGYAYLAITDHTKHLTIANGLDEERLRAQMDEIDRLNEELDGITLLKGSEVDILEDGRLDLCDDVLQRLDLVIGSVHSNFRLSQDRQTERVMRAMDHPRFALLGHPTGRLLLSREAYDIDIPRIVEHARQRGCVLELNANPQRLDLHDVHCRLAIEAGVVLAVNTDAHATGQLDNMVHGIGQARRGGVTRRSVLNTRTLPQLKKLLAAAMR